MKKLFITITGLVLSLAASAQEKEWHYKNYINVYKSNGTLNVKGDAGVLTGGIQRITGDFNGNYGFGGSIGHTYYVGKPIANDFRFAIEATWFDFNYSKYDKDGTNSSGTAVNVEYSKFSCGTGFGVSFTYQPVQDLNVKAYLQILPVCMGGVSSTTNDPSVESKDRESTSHIEYHGAAAFGLSAFYKNIGLGAEYRYTDVSNVSFVTLSTIAGSADDYRFFLQLRF